jgi:transcription initiation factor TFIIB
MSTCSSAVHEDYTNMEALSEDALWAMFTDLRNELDAPPDDDVEEACGSAPNVCMNRLCASSTCVLEENNYVCVACGTIQERFIDSNAEWRFYGSEDSKTSDPTRCGMPTNDILPGLSLGSVISLDGKQRVSNYMFKISKYQKWNSMSYKERNLYGIIDSMSIKAVNGGISPSIIDEAKMLYKQLSELTISRGESREGLIASSIYMSCKNNKVPRSAKEIAKIFNLNITAMTRACKKFHEIMKVNMNTSTTPDDFVLRFCSKLQMRDNVIELCRYVIKKEEEFAIISENAPPSIAAGYIYMVNVVCKLGYSKREISQVCDVSEITINKCYKKLSQFKNSMLTPEVIAQFT